MAALRHADPADRAAVASTRSRRRRPRWTAPPPLAVFCYIDPAAPRPADHRRDPDRDDLPARASSPRSTSPPAAGRAAPATCPSSSIQYGLLSNRHRRRLGRRHHRRHPRQHRRLLPDAHDRQEPGGLRPWPAQYPLQPQDCSSRSLAWGIGLLIFFPILWTILTSFKTEGEAIAIAAEVPVLRLDAGELRRRAGALGLPQVRHELGRSSRSARPLLGLLIAIPAAWAMAFAPGKRTKDLLMWMLSTKMMPPVGVLIPIYLIFRDLGLLDTPHRPDHRADADEPADHHLDALHLLQGNPRRDPRGRAHGRRLALARRSSMC